MDGDQATVFGALAAALVLFVWGGWRYDVVALMALIVVTAADIVPARDAFSGFGHPAVITVAAVLVVSRGLHNAGVVDTVAAWMSRFGERPATQVPLLAGLVALLSAFMNNVGALALLMPVAIRLSRSAGNPPSMVLMPLAFGSLLGGLITLIGTPPNIIIATFREQQGIDAFRMFDFTPVGLAVAVAGVAFISLVGWRLIPQRKSRLSPEELFAIEGYLSEVRVGEGSRLAGKRLSQLEQAVEADLAVVGLVRGQRRHPAPSGRMVLRPGDVLIVRADSEVLEELTGALGFEMAGRGEIDEKFIQSDAVSVMEAVVTPGSSMEGKTVRGIGLRGRYGVNLLAVARLGSRLRGRLISTRFRPGDVLLLQGETDTLQEAIADLGCLPLVERRVRIGEPRRVLLAVGVFGTALVLAALGVAPVQLAFVGAAVAMVLLNLLSLREAYDAIDWPVIVLLAAMIPVGGALESTGGAELLAERLVDLSEDAPTWLALGVVLVVTMFLSDVINNAAAAVLMAPIGISVAAGIGAAADPFLMAVAVGASSAFLTPIGHQSNTLVMVPGGYRFGDYWRMGLPLEAVIVAVAIPMIMWVWPP